MILLKNKKKKRCRERIIRNKDIEALGIDSAKMQINMCKKTPDRRMYDWAKERMEYGFDSRETWNFSQTLFEFLYTRLKMYERVSMDDDGLDMVKCSVYGDEKDDCFMSMRSYLDYILKDLELILMTSDEICFDGDAERNYMDAGKRVLSALSECVFVISII